MVNIEIVEGQLLVRDQICEYMDQGTALEHWSYLDYFLETYDGKVLEENPSLHGHKPSGHVPYHEDSNLASHC